MEFIPDRLYHFYNRGNNKVKIFYNRDNYLYFLRKIRKHMLPHCHILAYCLMTNHFHFLLNTIENLIDNSLNKDIGTMLSSYTKAINKQEKRSGSLFQQHSSAIDLEQEVSHSTSGSRTMMTNEYPFICFNYIHQNPYNAGMVKRMEDWEFSSFKDYCGIRNRTLCNRTLARELLDLPKDNNEFYKLSYEMIDKDKLKIIF